MTITGYRWRPLLRIVPSNGRVSRISLYAAMTDSPGPTTISLDYKPEMTRRKDANRTDQSSMFGFRATVKMEFSVLTMADVQHLSRIAEAANTEGTELYLSLDGGVVERKVLLTDFDGPKAIAKKTIIGALFSLTFVACDLVAGVPNMMSSSRADKSYIQNGDFEGWNDASIPYSWTLGGIVAPSTINRESSSQYAGIYCARIDTTANGETPILLQVFSGVQPGIAMRLTIAHKISSGASQFQVWLTNYTKNEWWSRVENAWSNPSGYYPDHSMLIDVSNTSWQLSTAEFMIDQDYDESDQYGLWIVISATDADSWYFDSISIDGPVLHEGYSTW